MCVHVSICTPTLFGKWSYILGCLFPCPVPLDCPSEEGPVLIQNKLPENIRGEFISLFYYFFYYYSHPDCLKLPHGEKQSEHVEFKSELTKIKKKQLAFRWIWGWTAIFALGCSLFRRCYEFCNSIPTKCPPPTLIPTSLTQHTHTPPGRMGAVGLRQGDWGYLDASSGVQTPHGWMWDSEDGCSHTTGVGCLCVCEGVYIFLN